MATSKFTPKTVLLIPDVHATPGDDLGRLEAMTDWVLDKRKVKLDKIVIIGDVFDFASLSLHDNHQPEWYERSLGADAEAGLSALDKIVELADSSGLYVNKDVHFIEGNHEDRYNKWMKSDNRLLTSQFPKTVSALIKEERAYRFNYHAFLKPVMIYGTAFQHYHVSGVMNRPHAGERPALSMLRQHHMSVVQGHKHTLDFAEHTRPDGSKLYGFVCGAFVNPKTEFAYAGAARKLWWNGFHLLHFYAPGEFDVESISLERIG